MSSSVTIDAVSWQPWGREAFEFARENDRPILLSINAVWCYWCHEMDSGAYADRDVIKFVNTHFTPVRVDTDTDRTSTPVTTWAAGRLPRS